jgi:hypothetical protein
MTHQALYLTFPNKSQLAVSVSLADDGLLVQGINRPDISFIIGGITDLQIMLSPAIQHSKRDPLGMSPADVLRYFEQSPILCIYVEDVRTVVLSHSEATGGDFQLSQDLQAIQGLINPSQADVAERLFGDRTKTGGSYRRRILAVLGATTTRLEGRPAGQSEKEAA